VLSGADLQGRCLTRAYAFPASREGWRALIGLFARVSEAVEVEDVSGLDTVDTDNKHHPSLTVAPFADLPSAMREIVETEEAGYVLHVSMHTHTPMPPLGAEFEGKPAPGVTHKDLKLAERIEALAGEV
jgi:hypothetical protein